MSATTGSRPSVTVVVPMLDEQGWIQPCLEAFAAQSYPEGLLEVVVVDGGSSDGSRAWVESYAATHRWCRVIDNPKRRAASAFNRGVEAAGGDVICLFSAHGVPSRSYVERSVEVLEETGAAGVGGRYDHVGLDPVSKAIGLAMVSPFGMASPHRSASTRQVVDTISHPAYWRSALRAVGPFDEDLLRNSDYELNYRMRERGMQLVFDPTIESIYRPRGSLTALAKQFWWYGRWKERVARLHPGSLRPRHLAAPAAVAVASSAPALLVTRRGRRVLAVAVTAYAGLCAAAVGRAHPRRHDASVLCLVACFPIMHGSWGAGFLVSFLEDSFRRKRHGG